MTEFADPPRGRAPRAARTGRRATLSREDQDALWSAAALYARRGAGRRGLVLRRTDVAGDERRVGAAGRTVEGEPMELLLWLAGRRDVARVTSVRAQS